MSLGKLFWISLCLFFFLSFYRFFQKRNIVFVCRMWEGRRKNAEYISLWKLVLSWRINYTQALLYLNTKQILGDMHYSISLLAFSKRGRALVYEMVVVTKVPPPPPSSLRPTLLICRQDLPRSGRCTGLLPIQTEINFLKKKGAKNLSDVFDLVTLTPPLYLTPTPPKRPSAPL